MNLKTWLNGERGRYSALAAHLAISAGRMSQIADGGVPNKYMEAVRDFTDGEVTLESMVRERAEKARRHAPVSRSSAAFAEPLHGG